MTSARTGRWLEVGDRVFARRYRFYDQQIVAVLGGDGALIVDTRSTIPQAREILDDLRDLGSPRVGVVVNTHGHYDHAFGNAAFRPAVIWGHERCRTMLEVHGERMRASTAAELPDLAADLAEVVIDPPDQVFGDHAVLTLGGREIRLDHLGRGHTDNDIVLTVPDSDVLCAGDLLENGATPYFGDGFPMDWPATAEAILAMTGERTAVVPGHGAAAGRAFVEASVRDLQVLAALAARVHGGDLDVAAALAEAPYPAAEAREPLERALAQLRGELDPG
jgi:glyoxylase-like metal-dependent hydrolase (beta-lactamase superfamily II)